MYGPEGGGGGVVPALVRDGWYSVGGGAIGPVLGGCGWYSEVGGGLDHDGWVTLAVGCVGTL